MPAFQQSIRSECNRHTEHKQIPMCMPDISWMHPHLSNDRHTVSCTATTLAARGSFTSSARSPKKSDLNRRFTSLPPCKRAHTINCQSREGCEWASTERVQQQVQARVCCCSPTAHTCAWAPWQMKTGSRHRLQLAPLVVSLLLQWLASMLLPMIA